MQIPCDMSNVEYCDMSGIAYPWSSVKKYIYENQGLLKRMYGDLKHFVILTNEIENRNNKYDKVHFWRKDVQDRRQYLRPRDAFQHQDEFSNLAQDSLSQPPTLSSISSFFLKVNPGAESIYNFEYTTENEVTTVANQFSEKNDLNLKSDLNQSSSNSQIEDVKINTPYLENVTSETVTKKTTEQESFDQPKIGAIVQERIISLKKGVNACPIKEEVVAPFWANNTRSETLALLNVHPFEQYVHLEKCAFEKQQMFCRQGCRCEQQYRLHRLLAFDPKNECRGIFADWFRFPSSCICVCYDFPQSNFYSIHERQIAL